MGASRPAVFPDHPSADNAPEQSAMYQQAAMPRQDGGGEPEAAHPPSTVPPPEQPAVPTRPAVYPSLGCVRDLGPHSWLSRRGAAVSDEMACPPVATRMWWTPGRAYWRGSAAWTRRSGVHFLPGLSDACCSCQTAASMLGLRAAQADYICMRSMHRHGRPRILLPSMLCTSDLAAAAAAAPAASAAAAAAAAAAA